jgi:hypothetical protein
LTEQNYPRPFQYGVELQKTPDHIDLSDIRPRLPGRENPDGLAYGNLNYPANANALLPICNKIRRRTNESIKYVKIIPMKNGAKKKAEFVLHADAANLEAHANALNGITIPQFGLTKFFFVERLRIHVAVESEFYKRRSKTLKGIADRAWDSRRIEMKIFDGELRYARTTFLILIDGSGRAAVQRVKAEIDDCVTEHALRGQQRNPELPKGRRSIFLNTVREFRLATDFGGIERLKKFYGEGTVELDEQHDPPRITIITSGGKLEKARDLVFKPHPKDADVGECHICIEEDVELLKVPGCGHASCGTCLNQSCSTNSANHLPLKCFSDGNYDNLLPIRWLKEHLLPVTYRSLFENAVEGQCQQDPDNFVHCTGHDCDQHLAIIKGVSKIICPKCLTVNCTTCKTRYHFGETCEQNQLRRNPHNEALQRYLERIGGKLCPRCSTPGIRIDGCFHIECPSCKVHYCWLCLADFDNMGDSYAHMDEAHGGPFGGRLNEEERLRMELALLGEEDE